MTTKTKNVKIKVTIDRVVFYKEESNWGIFGAIVKKDDVDKVKLNAYGNITLKGVAPKLEEGSEYIVDAMEVVDKKYGLGYEINSIIQDIPTSVEEQRAFLETLLTPLQVQNIYDVYQGEDVISMMKDGSFDFSKVNGMGEVTYQRIKDKVLGNIELQEALVALSKFGLNYNMVSKLVSHFGSASLLVEKIEKNPYILTMVDGLGFKKVDAYALKMGIPKESPFRINACVEHILKEEANNGHSWVTRKQMVKDATELLMIRQNLITDYIGNYSGQDFHIDDKRIALKKNYKYEVEIAQKLTEMLKAESRVSISGSLDERIAHIQKNQGFDFTDEQLDGIHKAVQNNVLILTGKAGTGKTAVLKGIVNVMAGNTYETVALSGKASQRIIESTGLTSSTIHRLVGWIPGQGFEHNAENPLPHKIIVIDETSMVNTHVFNVLVNAIRYGSKLIILGDTEQLEPIGVGNPLRDLIDSGIIPTVHLTKVHRQAQKSGILSTANQVREGIQFNDKMNFDNRRIGELEDLFFMPYAKSEDVFKRVIQIAKKYNGDLFDFQVIVPLKARGNLCTKNLNIELQKIFNGGKKPFLKRGNYDYKEGDKVIQIGNNYEVNVFNGTLGEVTHVDDQEKKITIDFKGVAQVEYTQEEMNQIDMAYALTVHKVQGSQFKHVLFALDYSAYVLLSRQLVYTALTRSQESCMLVCENKALINAISTDKSSKRNTFLAELLQIAKPTS